MNPAFRQMEGKTMKKEWFATGVLVIIGLLLISCNEPIGTGYVKINSEPSGADIYLDNLPAGQTNRVISHVTVGEHEVYLNLEGYKSWQGSVVVEEDDTALVDIELTPLENRVLWYYEAESKIQCCPAIGGDGTIYFGSFQYFYALNSDGTLKWSYSVEGKAGISPAIGSEGTVYFPVGSDMYALDTEGNFKWKYETGAEIYSSPAIGTDGTIYFGSKDYFFYALDPEGKLKWRYQTGNKIVSSPAIATDGTIYFGSEDNWLYALDTTGEQKWRYLIGRSEVQGVYGTYWPGLSPAIGSDGTIYATTDGPVYAITPQGNLRWKYDNIRAVGSPAIGPDGTIYFCAEEEYDAGLYALNPDGILNWIKGPMLTSAAMGSDGSIYLPGYCFNPDGSIKWVSPSGYSCCPAIGSDGTVFYGAGSTLYAIKGDSQGLADSPWPKFRGDAQNTGRVSE